MIQSLVWLKRGYGVLVNLLPSVDVYTVQCSLTQGRHVPGALITAVSKDRLVNQAFSCVPAPHIAEGWFTQTQTSHEPVINQFMRLHLSWCCGSLTGVPSLATGVLHRVAMSIVESELVFWVSTLTLEILPLGRRVANW